MASHSLVLVRSQGAEDLQRREEANGIRTVQGSSVVGRSRPQLRGRRSKGERDVRSVNFEERSARLNAVFGSLRICWFVVVSSDPDHPMSKLTLPVLSLLNNPMFEKQGGLEFRESEPPAGPSARG